METKSDSLLSKVASFFREKGNEEDAQASQKSAREAVLLSLRDRSRLKNHDDAVREREFKQLRKVIKSRRAAQGLVELDPPRPSVISQNSSFNTGNRASTLQKIDVAEAQLEQWWGGTSASPLSSSSTLPGTPLPGSAEPTASVPLTPDDDFDLDFTGMTPLAESEPIDLQFTQEAPAAQLPPTQASVVEEHPLSQIEECLRDAAICYSEGEYEKAEAMLLAALKGQRLHASEVELLTFALFDVYRATGQQSRFEVTAMDYAERAGRSPAEWFSIPEQLAAQSQADSAAQPAVSSAAASHAVWKCPATLNSVAMAQLQIAIGKAQTVSIDWRGLVSMDAAAAPTLYKLVQQWCHSTVRLEWTGAPALQQSLAQHTHLAALREDEIWWRIHMDVLCLLGLTEAFENLALDYCVAFEVSPPNPTEVRCTLVQETRHVALNFPSLTDIVLPTSEATGTPKPNASGVATYALCGDICGDAARALQDMRGAADKAQLLTVSCALLRRIDFSAANAIFNWTQSREASGLQVHFTQVPRLVLVFLVMLGLEKHATLSMRNL